VARRIARGEKVFLDIVRFLLSGVCHQIPEHSLMIGGQPLPLCARCTGTFLGVPVGLLALWSAGQGRRSGMPRGGVWLALAFPVVAWALDGVNSLINQITGRAWLYEPNNVLRLVTGMGLGLVLSALLYPVIHYAVGQQARDEPVLSRLRHVAALPLAGSALVMVLLAGPQAPHPLWASVVATATAAATVGVFVLVNGVMIILVLKKEGTARTWVKLAPYAAAGLTAALVEMGALALLRRLILV
jgi:uncharacterized membrane protein